MSFILSERTNTRVSPLEQQTTAKNGSKTGLNKFIESYNCGIGGSIRFTELTKDKQFYHSELIAFHNPLNGNNAKYNSSHRNGLTWFKRVLNNSQKHDNNCYISLALYYHFHDDTKNIKSSVRVLAVNRFVLDIDPLEHSKPFTNEQRKQLYADVCSCLPIKPHFAINSGSGMQFHICFEPIRQIGNGCEYNQINAELVKRVQNKVGSYANVDRLGYGSDCRCPYTINQRTGQTATIYKTNNSEILSISEIAAKLDFKISTYKKTKKAHKHAKINYKPSNETKRITTTTYNHLLKDYGAIAKVIGKGQRDLFLFTFCANINKFMNQDENRVYQNAMALNERLKNPLNEHEVHEIVRFAMNYSRREMNGFMMYSFKKQLEFMNLQSWQFERLDLFTPTTKEKALANRQEQDRIRKQKAYSKTKLENQKAKQELKQKFHQMVADGCTNSEIANALKISKATIKRWKKEVKK